MNQDTDHKELFLSWQGKVIGPHSPGEIQTLLKLGKIHSLYKIQSGGEWFLLRDHLADLQQQARDEQRRLAEQLAGAGARSHLSGAVQAARLVPDDGPFGDPGAPASQPQTGLADGHGGEESKGLAITSLVLSLLFFVPFLNGITWLLSLIFGHLALTQSEQGRPSGYGKWAWIGLWVSYIEISFFLLGLSWLAVMEFPNMTLGFFVLHGQMLSTGVAGLIGAGVLMLAIKLTTGWLVDFTMCFVGALLPSALGALGMLMVQTSVMPYDLTKAKGLVLIGAVNALLFVTQMGFWARFIRLPDDSELGLSRSALASLIYSVIFIFVYLGYIALLAILIK